MYAYYVHGYKMYTWLSVYKRYEKCCNPNLREHACIYFEYRSQTKVVNFLRMSTCTLTLIADINIQMTRIAV